MIYQDIENYIRSILINQHFFYSNQILPADAKIEGDQQKYCRIVFTYGELNDYYNIETNESVLLSLEIYEKKSQSTNTYEDLGITLRHKLKKLIHLIRNEESVAKLDRIGLVRNNYSDAEYNSIILNLSFNIVNME